MAFVCIETGQGRGPMAIIGLLSGICGQVFVVKRRDGALPRIPEPPADSAEEPII
jgi:hypothetical protein